MFIFQLRCCPGNLSSRQEDIQVADDADNLEALWPAGTKAG